MMSLLTCILALWCSTVPASSGADHLGSASRGVGLPIGSDVAYPIEDSGICLLPATGGMIFVTQLPRTPFVLYYNDTSTADAPDPEGLGPGWTRSFGQRLEWGESPRLLTDDGRLVEFVAEPSFGEGVYRGRAEENEGDWWLTIERAREGAPLARARRKDHVVEFELKDLRAGAVFEACSVRNLGSALHSTGVVTTDGEMRRVRIEGADTSAVWKSLPTGARVEVTDDLGYGLTVENGRLVRIAASDASFAMDFTYGSDGRLAGIASTRNAPITIAHPDPRATIVTTAAGAFELRSTPARTATVTTPSKSKLEYVFAADEALCAKVVIDGRAEIDREFDAKGRVVKSSDGDRVTEYRYAADGSMRAIVVESGSACEDSMHCETAAKRRP